MDNIKDEIISYIRRNRVSTTEVADCLGKSGAIEGVYPLTPQIFKVGEIYYTYAVGESNWNIHEDLTGEIKDKVVFIDALDVNGRALIGELVSKFAILYKEAVAIVTNGKMRDAHAIIKEKYPIWCTGVSPVGCFNKQIDTTSFECEILENRNKYEGSIAVCDDSGVVIIPKEKITQEFYEKLVNIEKQEDIWFDCIDRRKWNTFDTVCMKKYMTEEK